MLPINSLQINSQNEAVIALEIMSQLNLDMAQLELDMKARDTRAKAQLTADNANDIITLEALKADYELKELAIATWATDHRDELTQGGKVKTVKLATGSLSWKAQKASVVIDTGLKDEVIIEQLHEHGLERFIATKESLNKVAILNEPKAILGLTGISVSSAGEVCAVKPN
jgi:phage host-nuclease inhibitor protein Gam